jgi:SAM-dependent methyltransferase
MPEVAAPVAIDVRSVGVSTLHGFARAPRINAWIYGKLRAGVRGDVLEIGCGIGNLSRLIVDDLTAGGVGELSRAVFTDADADALAVLRAELRPAAGPPLIATWDLRDPPPPEIAARRFDTIVAVNVVEHLPDDLAAVRALAALLRPGGTLLVYVPACPAAFGALDQGLGHHRRYTRASLQRLLAGAGLACERPRYMNRLGLLGWLWQGKILGRGALAPGLITAFERIVALARLLDWLTAPLPIGLGLVAHARAPVR